MPSGPSWSERFLVKWQIATLRIPLNRRLERLGKSSDVDDASKFRLLHVDRDGFGTAEIAHDFGIEILQKPLIVGFTQACCAPAPREPPHH